VTISSQIAEHKSVIVKRLVLCCALTAPAGPALAIDQPWNTKQDFGEYIKHLGYYPFQWNVEVVELSIEQRENHPLSLIAPVARRMGIDRNDYTFVANGIAEMAVGNSMPYFLYGKNKAVCIPVIMRADIKLITNHLHETAARAKHLAELLFLKHERAHCLAINQTLGLLIEEDYRYLLAEEARADAAALLDISRLLHDAGEKDDLIAAVRKHRIFGAMAGDTAHGGFFITAHLLDERDASVSNAIRTMAALDEFDFDEYSQYIMQLGAALRVGPDGSAEQAEAWANAMGSAKPYVKPYLPSLDDIRRWGKSAWPEGDWREKATGRKIKHPSPAAS
jgi:hypothetical protein